MTKIEHGTRRTGAPLLRDEDFLVLGMGDMAYIKAMTINGRAVWSVHAADGTQISVLADRPEIVAATVRQHDMDPMSVH